MGHHALFDYLSIPIARSKQYIFGVLAAQALAIFSVWLAQIPWPASLCSSLVILYAAFKVNPRLIFLSHPHSVKRLTWDKEDWTLQLADQSQVPVEVKGEILVTTFLIVLNFRDQITRKTYAVALFADAVTPDEHRHLRILLKRKGI